MITLHFIYNRSTNMNYFIYTSLTFYLHRQGSREQLAIAEFANSLLVIPKTLAVNAAQDSADLVAKLRAYHNTSQINTERSSFKWYVIAALSGKVLHWPDFTELTTVFVHTRLWKTKHPRKRFENFCHSCVLLTDRIENHQSQLDSMT